MQLFQTMRFGNILFLGAFWNTVCHDFFFLTNLLSGFCSSLQGFLCHK